MTTRTIWSWTAAEQLLQDARFGARILTHAPGLSAVAIVLIALVIGGNATVYSMVNSILVSPAPGVSRNDLVVIRHEDPAVTITDPFVSLPNFEDYARHSTTIVDMAAWAGQRLTLGTPTGNFALFAGVVTPNFFDTFGVDVALGRTFTAVDDDGRDGLVVIISHRVWKERFNLAEDVVGRSVSINRVPATIVGVASAGFAGALLTPGDDLWMPIRSFYRATNTSAVLADRGQPVVAMAGRLRSSMSQARSEFATLSAQLKNSFPDAFTTYSRQGVVPLRNAVAVVSRYSSTALLPIADMAPIFLAVFSAVTLLTLIVVCANVANLLLGRMVERQRDTAVRQSLGASRGRIVRMLIAEGATLAIAAAIAASFIALWTSRALLQVIEPRPGLLAHARPDWTLGAYGMALALLATLAFSLTPALRSRRLRVLPLLKAGEQSIAGGRSRLTSALVVVQFAFSVLLITSAGLAYRSMTTLRSGNLGFNSDNLLFVTVRLGDGGTLGRDETAADKSARLAMLERVREQLATTIGVESASYTRRIPGATLMSTTPVRLDANRNAAAFVRQVGPDYLRTLGLTATAGRELTDNDRPGTTRAAVINQRLATELFAREPPIGHTVSFGNRDERVEIVGVVPDALVDGPSHDPHPRYLFLAEQQTPGNLPTDPSFIVRHSGSVDAVTPLVSRAIAAADAGLPIVSISTMNARLALVTELENMIVRLLVCFAALSLVIAALGHYAVAMFSIRRRTREFGVRMALGASAERIQIAVIREAFQLTVPGLLIGIALSAAVAGAFRNLLVGVTPVDPVTYLGVLMVIAATSIVASYLPARRAARVNVIEALRQE